MLGLSQASSDFGDLFARRAQEKIFFVIWKDQTSCLGEKIRKKMIQPYRYLPQMGSLLYKCGNLN